jgi:tyrosyl-tRNA synthetase
VKSVAEQLALIRRGVEQITPQDELVKKLERSVKTGKPLRVKYGIDPTGIDVHLGHTVPLRKLKLFQELGHQAVLIIGNYTALVGDPSGRDKTRDQLTEEKVEANARDYLKQVGRIIDISKSEVHHNGDWFGKMSFLDVLSLCRQITMQRMLERDDFTKRREEGTPIYLHECLYPLMQGRDSVEIKADVELGGSEQLFSLMVGRELQRDAGQESQVCITLPILRGLDGVRRMGKSLGNYVGVGEPASEQFGKTMSIADTLLREWFDLLTDRAEEELATLLDPAKTNPKVAKKQLAGDIVRSYHGEEVAQAARANWEEQFERKGVPVDIPKVTVAASSLTDGGMMLSKLLVALQLAGSGNEARRKVQEGAVSVGPNRDKLTDPNAVIAVTDGLIVRVGRKIVAVELQ